MFRWRDTGEKCRSRPDAGLLAFGLDLHWLPEVHNKFIITIKIKQTGHHWNDRVWSVKWQEWRGIVTLQYMNLSILYGRRHGRTRFLPFAVSREVDQSAYINLYYLVFRWSNNKAAAYYTKQSPLKDMRLKKPIMFLIGQIARKRLFMWRSTHTHTHARTHAAHTHTHTHTHTYTHTHTHTHTWSVWSLTAQSILWGYVNRSVNLTTLLRADLVL